VKLGKIKVENAEIVEADGSRRNVTPLEARLRNMSYFSPIKLEMGLVKIHEDETRDEKEMEWVTIGQMPTMLRSNRCNLSGLSNEELIKHGEDPLDPGGYFIVNGSERMLVTIEDLAPNKIILEKSERYSKVTEVAKVFSFPSVPESLPLIVIMKALGLETDKEIVTAISSEPEIVQKLLENLEEYLDIKNSDDAIEVIGKKVAHGQTAEYRVKRAAQVIDRYFLPHLGVESEDRLRKAYYLGRMVERVFELAFNKRTVDDKDHYANKRLRLAGDLLDDLFRVSFYNLARDMKYQLERQAARGKEPSIQTAVRRDVLTERIRHALATGNWVGGRTGVSQLLDRTTYMSVVSHLRRVISPLSRSQPHFEARDLHPTQFGRICPTETPEGPNCGLVKNLAISTELSTGSRATDVEKVLTELEVTPIHKH
jgi:DNA-directed RNA polymerase subunit B"